MLHRFHLCNACFRSNYSYTLSLFMLILHGYPCMVFSIIIASLVVKGSNPLFSAMNFGVHICLSPWWCSLSCLTIWCWVCYLYVLFCGLTVYCIGWWLSFLYSGRFYLLSDLGINFLITGITYNKKCTRYSATFTLSLTAVGVSGLAFLPVKGIFYSSFLRTGLIYPSVVTNTSLMLDANVPPGVA